MKRTKHATEAPIAITPEERDLSEIIKVLKANISAPRGTWPWAPDVCLTKGQMTFLVEVLEQHRADPMQSS